MELINFGLYFNLVPAHENFFETSIIKYDIGSKDINQYCVDEEEFYESLRRFLLVNNHQVTKKFEGWGE